MPWSITSTVNPDQGQGGHVLHSTMASSPPGNTSKSILSELNCGVASSPMPNQEKDSDSSISAQIDTSNHVDLLIT